MTLNSRANRVRKLEEWIRPKQWKLVDMLRACVALEKARQQAASKNLSKPDIASEVRE